jgi:hypothetical protein
MSPVYYRIGIKGKYLRRTRHLDAFGTPSVLVIHMDVIMPVEYYMIPKNGELAWVDLGRTAYECDFAKYQDIEGDASKVNQSLYEFYSAQGKCMFRGSPEQAHAYVMGRLGYASKATISIDLQMSLNFR